MFCNRLRGNRRIRQVALAQAVALVRRETFASLESLESRTLYSFTAPTSLPAGAGTDGVVIADVNADGKMDVVSSNNSSPGSVSVLLGNGDGTFGAKADFAAGSFAADVDAADFNNDGAMDLAVANSAGVGILLGQGDGTFGPMTQYAAMLSGEHIKTADLNGDDAPDVVTQSSAGVGVLLGDGDGTLQPMTSYFTGAGSNDVGVADFNDDGRPDIVVPNLSSLGSVNILKNNGDGTYQPSVGYYAYSAPFSIDVGDFNRDGFEDVVCPNSYASSAMTILYGHGDCTFSPPQTYALSYTPFAIDVGDFNNDGNEDLAERGGSLYEIQYGKGDGTFYGPTPTAAPGGPLEHSAVGDLNGDGADDLVGPGNASSIAVVMNADNDVQNLATGTAFQIAAPLSITAGNAFSATVAAVDANGAVASGFAGTVYFSTGDPSGRVLTDSYTFTPADAGVHTFVKPVTLLTLGSQMVTASAPFMTAATASINVTPAAAMLRVLAPATSTAGASFSVTVSATDGLGNVSTAYGGTVAFSSNDVQAGLPTSYTFTPADAGVHTFNVTLKTAGLETIRAAEVGGFISGSASVNVSALSASSIRLVGGAGPIGVARPVTVTARDVYGNIATTYGGTVHFTSSDPLATLPADTALTSGSAIVYVTMLTDGPQSLTATDVADATLTGTEAGIIAAPATAASLSIAGASSTNAGVSQSITVSVINTIGKIAADYVGTLYFASSDPQAGVPASYTFTAADAGVHTFNVTLKTAGAQTVYAADAANYTITGSLNGVAVAPAAPTTFSVAGFPATTAGVAQNFTVAARDAFGNVVPTYTGTVKFSSTDAQASLPANYTFTAADAGVHVFSGTLKTSGSQSAGQTITVADAVNASMTASQANISVNPAAMAGFSINTPSNIAAGAAFGVKVSAVDAFGNVIKGYAGRIHFTDSVGGATLPLDYTFSGLDGGVHTFTATLGTQGPQTLTVADLNDPSLKTSVVVNVGTKASGGGGGGGGTSTGGGGGGGGGGKKVI